MNKELKELENYLDSSIDCGVKFLETMKTFKEELRNAALEIYYNEQLNLNPEPAKILSKAEVEQALTNFAIEQKNHVEEYVIEWFEQFKSLRTNSK